MTSSSPVSASDEDITIDSSSTRSRQQDVPVFKKEELRQSIMAKRRARGEKQLKIEPREPQEMELTSAEIEKKERRREQNRRAAQRCRSKKRMNQKNVIQNYEKVVAKNRELQLEVDTLKKELHGLKRVCGYHSMCCPSFSNAKSEIIKIEPITDEELEDTIQEDSSYKIEDCIDLENFTSVSQLLPDINKSIVFNEPAHSSNSAKTMTSSYKNQQDDHQPQFDFLQQLPQLASSADINQQPTWRSYSSSLTDQHHSFNSCMFNVSKVGISPITKSDERHFPSQKHLRHDQHKEQQILQTEQDECITPDHEQKLFQQYKSVPLALSSTIPLTRPARPQSHHYPEQTLLLQLQNSPCQVVPSLRSPRPSSSTPRTSFSSDAIRHRSLSGGSVSEASRSCMEDKRFSSVSSEGSLYIDQQGGMYQELRTVEVPDIDADDVFFVTGSDVAVPLDGRDTNNNLEAMQDNNNIVTENDFLQFLANFTTINPGSELPDFSSDDRTTDYNTSGMEVAEVNPLLQISSDDLRLFSDIDDNEQAFDALNQILSDTHRFDC